MTLPCSPAPARPSLRSLCFLTGWFSDCAASARVGGTLLSLAMAGLLFLAPLSAALAHNTITKTNSTATVNPGGVATYTIKDDAVNTVANVTGIQITDTLPVGFSYLSTTSITLDCYKYTIKTSAKNN